MAAAARVALKGTLASMPKARIDSLLVKRGLFATRAQAEAAILAGDVHLGHGGRRAQKAGELVRPEVAVSVDRKANYVSRGGAKLENALRLLDIAVAGRLCCDVGSATGGFTDCLLQADAAHVTCIDVSYGQLDWRLRQDRRVTVLERTNARFLRVDDLSYRPQLICVDVSFISLTKVLPALVDCAADRFDCLALVKPQFEAPRAQVGKRGVVRSSEARRSALVKVGTAAAQLGCAVRGFCSSGVPGPAGNRESFVWLTDGSGRASGPDLLAAAREVEP